MQTSVSKTPSYHPHYPLRYTYPVLGRQPRDRDRQPSVRTKGNHEEQQAPKVNRGNKQRTTKQTKDRAGLQRETTYKELCEDYREYPEDRACEQSSIVLVNYKGNLLGPWIPPRFYLAFVEPQLVIQTFIKAEYCMVKYK